MDINSKVAVKYLRVLELAETLGNVSEACRQNGITRSSFYQWKRRLRGADDLNRVVSVNSDPNDDPAVTPNFAEQTKRFISQLPVQNTESRRPGEIIVQDIIFVGMFQGIGEIFLHLMVDTYGSLAFGFLDNERISENVVTFLHKNVIPFYKERDIPVATILTKSSKYFLEKEKRIFELYLTLNDIGSVTTDRNNSYIERFNQVVMDEFFLNQCQDKNYLSIEELQKEFSDWLYYYNYKRLDFGYRDTVGCPINTVEAYMSTMQNGRIIKRDDYGCFEDSISLVGGVEMNVRKYLVGNVTPGMELANPVINENGQFIVPGGTVLTGSLIDRLKLINVEELDILVANKEKAPTDIGDPVVFKAVYNEIMDVMKKCFSAIQYLKEVPLNQMRSLIDKSIDPLVNSVGIIDHLHTIRRQDDYTFHHCINVAVISGILGKWMGLSEEEIKDVILSGLLHDVGKTVIPLEILNKPAKLTSKEMEIMKGHTVHGYKLLQATDNVKADVLYGVLQHHERIDGSGYPFGISDKKIHIFAKIIAVADIYDAMTSDRAYQKKRTPFEVVEVIYREMFDKLDPNICFVFLNNVGDSFIGTQVKLSDGRRAEVVCRGVSSISRFMVCTREGEFIDLGTNKEISIVELV
ncbi:MAG: rpfG 8 [Firmicutes bacterium]|nr:rpfG 8 [Bacillota bacterium]